jgi:hypothetical protein
VRNHPNPFEQIFGHFADRLRDAPGESRLARLARTAKHIPEPLLMRLTALVLQIGDPRFVGDDIAVHLFEVSRCDARYSDATAFVSALSERLQLPQQSTAASNARNVFRERVAWWRMALSRAGELSRWPALKLADLHSNA